MYLFNYLLVISTAATPNPPYVQSMRWEECLYYFKCHANYKTHQEPTDIAGYGAKWGQWVNFPNKIRAIEAKVGHVEGIDSLLTSLDFKAIYDHPDYYLDAALDFLSMDELSEQQKKIVLYGLTSLWQNIAYAKKIHDLYVNKKISPQLFTIVLEAIRVVDIPISAMTQKNPPLSQEALWLKFIQQAEPKDSILHKAVAQILSKALPQGSKPITPTNDVSNFAYVCA